MEKLQNYKIDIDIVIFEIKYKLYNIIKNEIKNSCLFILLKIIFF